MGKALTKLLRWQSSRRMMQCVRRMWGVCRECEDSVYKVFTCTDYCENSATVAKSVSAYGGMCEECGTVCEQGVVRIVAEYSQAGRRVPM